MVSLRSATASETQLGRELASVRRRAGSLRGAANLYADTLASGRRAERSDAIGAGAADVAQQMGGMPRPRSLADITDRAMQAGRARSRIQGTVERDFDARLLQDRVAFTGGVEQRRSQGLGVLQTTANLQNNIALANKEAAATKSAAKANLFGAALGAGAGFAAGGISNRREGLTFFGNDR